MASSAPTAFATTTSPATATGRSPSARAPASHSRVDARSDRRRARQLTSVANDGARQRMPDLDVETEAPGFDGFMSIRARAKPHRQRNPEHAPAPEHERQAAVFDNERHRKRERAEALTQEMRVATLARELSAREALVAERSSPSLDTVGGGESNRDGRFMSAGGKADCARNEPRKEARAALDGSRAACLQATA